MTAVVLVILSLLGSELAARGLYAAFGRPYDAASERRHFESIVGGFDARKRAGRLVGDAAPLSMGEVVQHPYVGWENLGINRFIVETADYYRTPEAQQNFDVYLFGGSVAQTLGIDATDRVIAALETDPRVTGRSIMIHNYARAAYKQPQQVMFLGYLLNLGHEPDAVIEIDGYNEVAMGWNNAVGNVHPLHPDLTHWGTTARGQRLGWPLIERLHAAKTAQERVDGFGAWALSTGIWKSCVLGNVAIHRMRALKRQSYAAYEGVLMHLQGEQDDPVLRGPPFQAGTGPGFGLIVRAWEESSRIMHGICREHSIPYLHVLQPTLFDTGSKPLTAKEIAGSAIPPAWIEGVRTGYPLLRLAGERLRAANVPFFDASGIFRDVTEDLYNDGCHFGKQGNVIFADAIAAAFVASIATER